MILTKANDTFGTISDWFKNGHWSENPIVFWKKFPWLSCNLNSIAIQFMSVLNLKHIWYGPGPFTFPSLSIFIPFFCGFFMIRTTESMMEWWWTMIVTVFLWLKCDCERQTLSISLVYVIVTCNRLFSTTRSFQMMLEKTKKYLIRSKGNKRLYYWKK